MCCQAGCSASWQTSGTSLAAVGMPLADAVSIILPAKLFSIFCRPSSKLKHLCCLARRVAQTLLQLMVYPTQAPLCVLCVPAGCTAPYRASLEAAAAAIRDATLAAGDVNPPVILINGVGQTAYGFNWGDGFMTDAAKISQFRLSDPRGFFTADNASARNYKIVLAPHTYGGCSQGSQATAQGTFSCM